MSGDTDVQPGAYRRQRAIKPGAIDEQRSKFIDELIEKRRREQNEKETNGTGKRK